MKNKFLFVLFLMLTANLGFSSILRASACEPEVGDWTQFKKKPSSYEFSGVRKLPFNEADIFSGPRGFLNTKADPNGLQGPYTVKTHWAKGQLELRFFKAGLLKATLYLEKPPAWTFFQTQTRHVPARNGRPQMYKEIRLSGKVRAGGEFSLKNSENTRFFLVFKGAGGSCFEGNDFTDWVLRVTGPDPENVSSQRKASFYSLRGSFR